MAVNKEWVDLRFIDGHISSSRRSCPRKMALGSSKLRGLHIALNSSNNYTFRPPVFQVDYLVIGGGMSSTYAGLLIPHYILTTTFFQVSWDSPSLASLCSAIRRKAHRSWSVITVLEKKQGELLESKYGSKSHSTTASPRNSEVKHGGVLRLAKKLSRIDYHISGFTIPPTHSRLVCV